MPEERKKEASYQHKVNNKRKIRIIIPKKNVRKACARNAIKRKVRAWLHLCSFYPIDSVVICLADMQPDEIWYELLETTRNFICRDNTI